LEQEEEAGEQVVLGAATEEAAMAEEEQGEQEVLEQATMGAAVVRGARQAVVWVKVRIAQRAARAVAGEAGQVPCPMWAVGRVPIVRRPPTNTWDVAGISTWCAPGETLPASLQLAAFSACCC